MKLRYVTALAIAACAAAIGLAPIVVSVPACPAA